MARRERAHGLSRAKTGSAKTAHASGQRWRGKEPTGRPIRLCHTRMVSARVAHRSVRRRRRLGAPQQCQTRELCASLSLNRRWQRCCCRRSARSARRAHRCRSACSARRVRRARRARSVANGSSGQRCDQSEKSLSPSLPLPLCRSFPCAPPAACAWAAVGSGCHVTLPRVRLCAKRRVQRSNWSQSRRSTRQVRRNELAGWSTCQGWRICPNT